MEVEEIYSALPRLETDRLILRKLTLEDADDMFFYCSNEAVSEYVTWDTHQTLSDTDKFIRFVLDKYEKHQVAPWGIEYKGNGRFIGTIDFISWQPNQKIAEIGYVLSQDYWGQGLMTEAAREVIKFGFEHMNLVRIQARCFVENIGSARVMEKAGMSFEGIIRKGLFIKGKHRDGKLYSIVKEEMPLVSPVRPDRME